MGTPTLVVVSGPPGAGKTTLAHRLARTIGCPAICRDEIKEGMVHARPGFEPGQHDPINLLTFDVFVHTLQSLLENEVTTVAEAAFQHHLWRQALEPLMERAHLRVVQCQVDEATARARQEVRQRAVPTRSAHADATHLARPPLGDFDYLRLAAPTLSVVTTDGYQPGLDAIVRFVGARADPPR